MWRYLRVMEYWSNGVMLFRTQCSNIPTFHYSSSFKHLRPQFDCAQHRGWRRLTKAAKGCVDHRAADVRQPLAIVLARLVGGAALENFVLPLRPELAGIAF